MEIRVFALVLLLVLSETLPAEAQSWRAFKRKHIYLNMNTTSCTQRIKDENINSSGTCRPKISFIKATDTQVQAICQKAGTPLGGNLYESNEKFTVVKCIVTKSTPPCEYSGRQSLKYVTVKCEGGFPVHYHSERS
ncbi:ribonuclease pancreatic-like [Tachysurus ichikawai]